MAPMHNPSCKDDTCIGTILFISFISFIKKKPTPPVRFFQKLIAESKKDPTFASVVNR
jgi:hypothetical protein